MYWLDHNRDIIENRNVLMKIIMMLKITQLLRPNHNLVTILLQPCYHLVHCTQPCCSLVTILSQGCTTLLFLYGYTYKQINNIHINKWTIYIQTNKQYTQKQINNTHTNKYSYKQKQYTYWDGRTGPAGPVLARLVFIKVKAKFHFYKKQVINKSAGVILGLRLIFKL